MVCCWKEEFPSLLVRADVKVVEEPLPKWVWFLCEHQPQSFIAIVPARRTAAYAVSQTEVCLGAALLASGSLCVHSGDN